MPSAITLYWRPEEICSANLVIFLGTFSSIPTPLGVLHTLECLFALQKHVRIGSIKKMQTVLKQCHGIFSRRIQHASNQRLPEETNSRVRNNF